MLPPLPNPRAPEAEVDAIFPDRWSPRSFDSTPLTDEELACLLEAARWAPSCYNEQPWLFLYAVTATDRERFSEVLSERNRLWAPLAPLLLFVVARRTFVHSGKPNRHASFDAGAAWMALALQARRRGLYAHAMAGFSREKAHAILGVPEEEFEVVAAVAVGRRASAEKLPAELAEQEAPNGRKPLSAIAREGSFSPR